VECGLNTSLSDIAENYAGDCFARTLFCPICGGRSKIAHPAYNSDPHKPYKFDLRVCIECGHGWIDPMPSQGLLNYLYGRAAHSVIGVGWSVQAHAGLSVPERFVRARELSDGVTPRRYFELGVGKGALYSEFLKAGWECHGVEPGVWGHGFPGVVSDIDVVPRSFLADRIVALDVLEHIADPKAMIRTLRQLSASDATLYCAMPNRQSFRARVGRDRWRMLRPLGHVNYWSRKSVLSAFSQSGFRVEELFKTDLWDAGPIRTLKSLAAAAIERFGAGDQWIVIARAN
jgi:rRNA maturation protein Nop10